MATPQDPEDPLEYPGPKPPSQTPPPKKDESDIIGKSGFNYTQRWGAKRGQTGVFTMGSRPPSEVDFDAFTDAEKLAVFGTTDGKIFDEARAAWQKRYAPGEDLYNERVRAFDAIEAANPRSFEDVERALIAAGFDPNISAQGSLFKQLSQIWKGNPLVNTGAYQEANKSSTFRPGFEGIRDYLPGGGESRRFQDWQRESDVSGGKAGTGMSIDPATGLYDGKYDRLGWEVNPRTGQRTGRHYLGSLGGQGAASMPTALKPAAAPAGFGTAPQKYADVLSSTSPPTAPPTPPTAPPPAPAQPAGLATPDLASRVQQFVNTLSNPQGTSGVVPPTPAAPAAPPQPVANSAASTQPTGTNRPGFGAIGAAETRREPSAIAQRGWYKKPGFGAQPTW